LGKNKSVIRPWRSFGNDFELVMSNALEYNRMGENGPAEEALRLEKGISAAAADDDDDGYRG